jgi:hypothetical protein
MLFRTDVPKSRRAKLVAIGARCDVEEFDSSDRVVDGMPDDHFSQIAGAALKGGV